MVDGGDAPRDADPQEDIYRVASGHVADARVRVLVLAGGHLARERVCNKSGGQSEILSYSPLHTHIYI